MDKFRIIKCIRSIIISVVISAVVIYMAINSKELSARIALICISAASIGMLLTNIFALLGKDKLSNLFYKIYRTAGLLFLCCIAAIIDYQLFISKQYIFIAFTLIFWFTILYTLFQTLFGKEPESINIRKVCEIPKQED